MLRITKTICVDRNPYDCFTYLADLRKLVEWDSNVVSASKRTQGPVAKGSRLYCWRQFRRHTDPLHLRDYRI